MSKQPNNTAHHMPQTGDFGIKLDDFGLYCFFKKKHFICTSWEQEFKPGDHLDWYLFSSRSHKWMLSEEQQRKNRLFLQKSLSFQLYAGHTTS